MTATGYLVVVSDIGEGLVAPSGAFVRERSFAMAENWPPLLPEALIASARVAVLPAERGWASAVRRSVVAYPRRFHRLGNLVDCPAASVFPADLP